MVKDLSTESNVVTEIETNIVEAKITTLNFLDDQILNEELRLYAKLNKGDNDAYIDSFYNIRY